MISLWEIRLDFELTLNGIYIYQKQKCPRSTSRCSMCAKHRGEFMHELEQYSSQGGLWD